MDKKIERRERREAKRKEIREERKLRRIKRQRRAQYYRKTPAVMSCIKCDASFQGEDGVKISRDIIVDKDLYYCEDCGTFTAQSIKDQEVAREKELKVREKRRRNSL